MMHELTTATQEFELIINELATLYCQEVHGVCKWEATLISGKSSLRYALELLDLSINLLVVYRESVNLIGCITRRLSADSLKLWIANENRSPIYFNQSRSFKFLIVYHEF